MSSSSYRLPLLLLAAVCSLAAADLTWWQKAVLYQVYPRSFQDTDGNGIGDLKGILQHVNYLQELGVDGIWMNPIYDSPLKDFGYDISNYTSIDKTFGTFADFSALVDKLHSMGMYIMVDLVPNHSSNEHPWFEASENGEEEYKDFYVWQKGTWLMGHEPNNWVSVMGGSAWQWSEKRKQYYYHAFLKEQPDLNYRNPKVVEAMKGVLKFWLDLGVDGFRVDAVPFLVEDDQLRNNPACSPPSPGCLQSTYTQNQPGTYKVLAQLYKVLQDYNNPNFPGEKFMVTEVYADMNSTMNYFEYDGEKTGSMPFNFQLINVNLEDNGTMIKGMVDTWVDNLIEGGWSSWVTGNHDQNRVGHKVGIPMADGMNMLVLLLPGTSFSYYGEELGMDDTYVDCFQMQDTQAIRQANGDCGKMEGLSRDPERTPMQWDSSVYAGFSKAKPWLPVNPDYYGNNVEVQIADPRSHLNTYKNLIPMKREMESCKNLTTLSFAEGWVFGFKRFGCDNVNHEYVVLLNFNNDESTVSLSQSFSMNSDLFVRVPSRFSTRKSGDTVAPNNIVMRPKESLVLATVSQDQKEMSNFENNQQQNIAVNIIN